MYKIIAFLVLSIPVIYLSRKSIVHIRSHGFYRFLAWECIVWLAVSNIQYWFVKPFSPAQIISWICLLYSIYPLVEGVKAIKKMGKSDETRDTSLHGFEKTGDLIETGIFRYIRHPMYSSLLFLTWGIFFKHITLLLFIIALLSTVFLLVTALSEEKENMAYFGDRYGEYMKRTKRFVPFII
jgi:protein-S-isoprenylcysteine O-methyltransferase Ste14